LPADCQQYPSVCALLPPDQLQEYTVQLPTGMDDVLLRVSLRIESNDDGSSPVVLWLDDLRLE